MSIFGDVSILLMLSIILIVGVKRIESDKEQILTRLNAFRGWIAIVIIVGHVVADYSSSILTTVLSRTQFILVAFFFFVSSYGLTKSFYKKDHYLSSFLVKKIVYLVTLAFISYLIYCVLDVFVADISGYIPNSVKEFPKTFWISTNWYMWELLIWYVIFYISFRLSDHKKRVVMAWMLSIGAAVCFYALNGEPCWYASVITFPLGISLFMNENRLLKFFKNIRGYICLVILLCVGMMALLFPNTNIIGGMLRNVMCLAVMLVIILIGSKVEIGNPVIRVLNKISAELYLMQFPFLIMTREYDNWLIRMVIVLVCTFLAAGILHILNLNVKRLLERIIEKDE
ncbi:MAG: acyltransferase family protein [Lachnospiraceae bacterium]|nr:acyltransferase family protein [Lachnospiraceae bacterium]